MRNYGCARTNRDIYEWICDLADAQRGDDITLEAYLCALLEAVAKHAAAPALSPDEFLDLLELAFTANAPPFEDAWRSEPASKGIDRETITYAECRAQLCEQIVDLKEMRESGALADEMRYLSGVDAQSGVHWYNFDPCTYLECAAAGTFARAIQDVDQVSWRTFVFFLWCGSSYE